MNTRSHKTKRVKLSSFTFSGTISEAKLVWNQLMADLNDDPQEPIVMEDICKLKMVFMAELPAGFDLAL